MSYAIIKCDSGGRKLWQRLPKLESSNEWDGGWAIALDPFGNLYVGGSLGIHKYDSDGNLIWLAQAGWVRAIAVSADGSVCGVGPSSVPNEDKHEIVKVDTNGQTLWTSHFPGTSPGYVAPFAKFDGAGNVCTAGADGTAKFDRDGKLLWFAPESRVNALEVDRFGNIYVAGSPYGYEPGYGLRTIKYDPDGRIQWVAHYSVGDGLFHRAAGLKLDDAGNVLITGTADNDIVTVKYVQSEHPVGRFKGLTSSGANEVEILFEGNPGSEYRLEASTDLVNWQPLTNVLSSPVPMKWVDDKNRELPSRFYRAVIAPNIRP